MLTATILGAAAKTPGFSTKLCDFTSLLGWLNFFVDIVLYPVNVYDKVLKMPTVGDRGGFKELLIFFLLAAVSLDID